MSLRDSLPHLVLIMTPFTFAFKALSSASMAYGLYLRILSLTVLSLN